MAELGFLGDIVTTRVTIPLACGQRFSMGVLDIVGFAYFNAGLSLNLRRFADCLHVAIYTRLMNTPILRVLVMKYLTSTSKEILTRIIKVHDLRGQRGP
jgi:hypothetical protein